MMLTCMPSEDSNPHAHSHSLIRVRCPKKQNFASLAFQNLPSEGSDQTTRNVQADLKLCRTHMSEGTLSDVEAQMLDLKCEDDHI